MCEGRTTVGRGAGGHGGAGQGPEGQTTFEDHMMMMMNSETRLRREITDWRRGRDQQHSRRARTLWCYVRIITNQKVTPIKKNKNVFTHLSFLPKCSIAALLFPTFLNTWSGSKVHEQEAPVPPRARGGPCGDKRLVQRLVESTFNSRTALQDNRIAIWCHFIVHLVYISDLISRVSDVTP